MVVPVEAELAVELLSVVLEALDVTIGALREQGTVWIVVVVPYGHVREKGLHDAVVLRDDHSVVSLMVLQIEIICGDSGAAEGVVPVVGQSHRKAVVDEYVPVYVVRRRGLRAHG